MPTAMEEPYASDVSTQRLHNEKEFDRLLAAANNAMQELKARPDPKAALQGGETRANLRSPSKGRAPMPSSHPPRPTARSAKRSSSQLRKAEPLKETRASAVAIEHKVPAHPSNAELALDYKYYSSATDSKTNYKHFSIPPSLLPKDEERVKRLPSPRLVTARGASPPKESPKGRTSSPPLPMQRSSSQSRAAPVLYRISDWSGPSPASAFSSNRHRRLSTGSTTRSKTVRSPSVERFVYFHSGQKVPLPSWDKIVKEVEQERRSPRKSMSRSPSPVRRPASPSRHYPNSGAGAPVAKYWHGGRAQSNHRSPHRSPQRSPRSPQRSPQRVKAKQEQPRSPVRSPSYTESYFKNQPNQKGTKKKRSMSVGSNGRKSPHKSPRKSPVQRVRTPSPKLKARTPSPHRHSPTKQKPPLTRSTSKKRTITQRELTDFWLRQEELYQRKVNHANSGEEHPYAPKVSKAAQELQRPNGAIWQHLFAEAELQKRKTEKVQEEAALRKRLEAEHAESDGCTFRPEVSEFAKELIRKDDIFRRLYTKDITKRTQTYEQNAKKIEAVEKNIFTFQPNIGDGDHVTSSRSDNLHDKLYEEANRKQRRHAEMVRLEEERAKLRMEKEKRDLRSQPLSELKKKRRTPRSSSEARRIRHMEKRFSRKSNPHPPSDSKKASREDRIRSNSPPEDGSQQKRRSKQKLQTYEAVYQGNGLYGSDPFAVQPHLVEVPRPSGSVITEEEMFSDSDSDSSGSSSSGSSSSSSDSSSD